MNYWLNHITYYAFLSRVTVTLNTVSLKQEWLDIIKSLYSYKNPYCPNFISNETNICSICHNDPCANYNEFRQRKTYGIVISKAFIYKIERTFLWVLRYFHQGTSRLPCHDNRASYSHDTIWFWKFKVKGQGQRYSSQRSVQMTHFLSVSHQGILTTPIPFVPWQSGLPFRDTIWPWKFKVNGQGQAYPSQRSIQLTHFLFISHQLDQPFLRYGK